MVCVSFFVGLNFFITSEHTCSLSSNSLSSHHFVYWEDILDSVKFWNQISMLQHLGLCRLINATYEIKLNYNLCPVWNQRERSMSAYSQFSEKQFRHDIKSNSVIFVSKNIYEETSHTNFPSAVASIIVGIFAANHSNTISSIESSTPWTLSYLIWWWGIAIIRWNEMGWFK